MFGRVAFSIFGLNIYWYGIFMALGFISALFIVQRKKEYAGLTNEYISDLTILAMVAGIIGARIFYVIQFWSQFKNNPLDILKIYQGGLVFYGGFIVSFIAVYIFCRKKKLSFLRIIDLIAPALAFAHALGRIGCFMNGCCFGKKSELFCAVSYPYDTAPAIKYPDLSNMIPVQETLQNGMVVTVEKCNSLPIHPVQLYEAGGNIIIAAILFYMLGKLKNGQIAALYLLLYGVLRFSDEFLRGDHNDFILGIFTPAQTVCLFLVPAGIILFFIFRKNSSENGKAEPES